MTASWEARSAAAGPEACADESCRTRRGQAARPRTEPRAAVVSETTSGRLAGRRDADEADPRRARPAARERGAGCGEPSLCRAARDARRRALRSAHVEGEGAVGSRVEHQLQSFAAGSGLGRSQLEPAVIGAE